MRKVFVALALLAIIASSTMLPEIKQSLLQNLNKMKNSKYGRNILSTIQIEMSSKDTQNIVDRILQLLEWGINEVTTELDETVVHLHDRTDYCDTTRVSYEGQIQQKKTDINNAEQSLPVLHAELSNDQTNKKNEEDSKDRQSQALSEAHDINEKSVKAFEKSIRNHNAMTEALQQARALIVQLQSSSFLQKNNNILAQISAHHTASLKALEGHKHKGLFNLLMQMSQDVGIQADQHLVSSVIEIIDDLLKNEADSVQAETEAESQRVSEYNQNVANLENGIRQATEEISRLESEIVRLVNEIALAEENIKLWGEQLAELETVLVEHNNQCEIDLAAINKHIVDLNEGLDVLKAAREIFQGQAITDIKPVVDGMDYSEIEA